jgi:hypothetical protein
MSRSCVFGLALAALTAAVPVSAQSFAWPGPAPCDTTLTACVNGVPAGFVVEIVTSGPIDEDVTVGQSILLRAYPPFVPSFATGRNLVASSSLPTPLDVTFQGMVLTDGEVRYERSGPGSGSFTVRRMRLYNPTDGDHVRVRVNATNTGSLAFDIAENEIEVRTDLVNAHAIQVDADGPAAIGKIRFNRIRSVGDVPVAGIAATRWQGGLELDVFANEVRGDFRGGAITVSELAGAASPPVTARLVNNVVVGPGSLVGGPARNGISVLTGNAGIDLSAVNNTVTSTRSGLFLGLAVGGASGTIAGDVRNNLVAFNHGGLLLDDGSGTAAGVGNQANLVYGNSVNSYTPGPGTVLSDPLLLSTAYPRLRAGSPAINAADSAYVGLLLAVNGLPLVDGDGMRRIIGAGASGVDIGAYEFGDTSFVATKPLVGGHSFALDHLSTNGQSTVRPLLTDRSLASNPYPAGVWYAGTVWEVFNQGGSAQPMTVGTTFNVFVPGVGGPTGASYRHVATAGNTSGGTTRLDQGFLNGTTEAIVLATGSWIGVYNDNLFAVGNDCVAPGPNCWFLRNEDIAAMPLNAAFNVYAQDPSPNAYVHRVETPNRPFPYDLTLLDHPLLNGVSCADVQVTLRAAVGNDNPYGARYDKPRGRWTIVNAGVAEMPLGARFNVLVNPRQVFECTDVIFVDGFDS